MSAHIEEEPGGYVVECDECIESWSLILFSQAEAVAAIHSVPGHEDAP